MSESAPDAGTPWLDPAERSAWLGLVGMTLLLPTALDSQLQRDAGLSTFEYLVLAMLSEADGRRLQLKTLAARSSGSLSRLSHVVTRLEKRGWVCRRPCPESGRSTEALLTAEGYAKVAGAAPEHVRTVREVVFDALTSEQVDQLRGISESVLDRLEAHRGCAAR